MSNEFDKKMEDLMYERHMNYINNMICANGKIYGGINKEQQTNDKHDKKENIINELKREFKE